MPPLLYEDPILLRQDLHSDAALLAADSFQFAARAIAVPINITEFARAARCYPIVFADTEDPFPLAVTGFRDGANLFVDAGGQWAEGAYVPAYVRRYPFLPVTTEGSETLMLAIDRPRLVERTGDLPESEPQRLFGTDGASALSKRALAFCERYHRDHLRTATFVAALREQDLLTPQQADVRLPDETRFRVDGFRTIDRAALRRLPDALLAEWFRSGWLDLAALAEASQANWQTLLHRNAATAERPETAAPPARRRAGRRQADA